MKFQSVVVFVAFLFFSVELRAQTTAFSYQGQLSSNNVPANGLYDLRFQLFDASSNAVSGAITNSPVGVTNGIFSTTLDFGDAVFDGSDRWLQIGVRNYGDTNAYTTLSPLQPITSTPYAIRAIAAASATNAMFLTQPLQGTNVVGTIPVANLPANVALLNSNEIFSSAITAGNPANIFGGDGSRLKNLTATNLSGIVPDANLSANVALQSNPNLNFAGAVSATNFVGAGHGLTNVPGAFFWVTVVGSSTPAFPNVGYICTNNLTPVTIMLSTSMSIGDTFKVAGIGDAGWIIAQNAGQTIFSGNLSGSIGQGWKTNGPGIANWTAIACSSDGTTIAAANNGGYIYSSINSGATWRTGNTPGYWSAIASSADGTKMIATAGYTTYNSQSGFIYTSTDSGQTWTKHSSSPISSAMSWSSVASSADGSKLVAAVNNGQIYVSANSGGSWSAHSSPTALWTSVASSSDGTKLVAVEGNGAIYVSTDSGSTWLLSTNVGSGVNLDAVACSADGSRLIAGTSSGIYISTDSGATWIHSSGLSGNLVSIASSADGSRLAAAIGGSGKTGNILGSSNSGATWSQFIGPPTLSWSGIASSADGSVLAACAYNSNIYVSSQSSTTTGATGYLSGAQHSAIELIYVGNGNFLPLNHEGTIRAY